MALKHEQENSQMSTLTETLRSNLNNPVSSPEFNLYTALDKVLSGVGLSAADSGGKITFYGKDRISMSMSARRCGGLHPSSSANGRGLMVIKLHLPPIRKILSFTILV